MAQTNHWPIDAVLCKEFSGYVFYICLLANFDDSGKIGISYLPFREILNITQNTIGLGSIIVLLRDKNSAVLKSFSCTTKYAI